MHDINKPSQTTYWLFYNDQGEAVVGSTHPNEQTTTGQPHGIIEINPETFAFMVQSASMVDKLPEMPFVGQDVIKDNTYNYSGSAVVCYQTHTRQSDWNPMTTPALFGLAKAPFGPWVQPLGAHDSYDLGAKVTHNGQTWVSDYANNVWEPGVFGWSVI